MSANPIQLNLGVPIEEIRLGFTYQISDNTSYWNGSFGKCVAVHVDRREVTVHIDNHPVSVRPEELRFICK